MSYELQYIASRVNQLKPGECVTVPNSMMGRIGRGSLFGDETPVQRILAKVLGSNYSIQVIDEVERDRTTFRRLTEEEQRRMPPDERMNVDPDREHLFERLPNGRYRLRRD